VARHATVELDFFGASPVRRAHSPTSTTAAAAPAYPTSRTARTTLRIGRTGTAAGQHSRFDVPHPFPLGHGSGGFVGWRFTQVRFMKTLSARRRERRRGSSWLCSAAPERDAGTSEGASAGERAEAADRRTIRLQHYEVGGYVVAHVITRSTPHKSYMVELGANTTGAISRSKAMHTSAKDGAPHRSDRPVWDFKGWGAWAQVGYALNTK